MFNLFKAKGEGIAGVERVFTELEAEIDDVAALRFLRAQFYVRSMNWERAERATFYRKAVEEPDGPRGTGQWSLSPKGSGDAGVTCIFRKTNSNPLETPS